ncbi:MAG TPA: BPSL0067 family protein [Stellaceae bacterium]|nr:BPSL0067 family protein [Stellaceae bacterium]
MRRVCRAGVRCPAYLAMEARRFGQGQQRGSGHCHRDVRTDGAYGNTPGRSHAAVFHQQNPSGLLVWDQWVHHPVAPRLIRFKGGEGLPVDDGDQFYVIEAV